jgi:hypothetical protein
MRWSFQNYIMLKSSKKKLIAIGCSYTEHYFTSHQSPNLDFDFPRWPQHLADMLDMECINLGKAGSGNDQILAKTVDATLNEKNIGLVVLMWSEWQRIGFQRNKNWNKWRHAGTRDTEGFNKFILENQNVFHATRNTMRTFIHAEKLLKDLPYLFIQGTFNIPLYSITELEAIDCSVGGPNENLDFNKVNDSRRMVAKEIIVSPYLNYIEKNIGEKFVGWPVMNEIGGYCIDHIFDVEDPHDKPGRWSRQREGGAKFRMSKTDAHPNAAGHKIIAEFLYEQYKEIYNEH